MNATREAGIAKSDLLAVELKGVAAATGIAYRARRAALAAFKRGDPITPALAGMERELKTLLAEAMSVAHVSGIRRTIDRAKPAMSRSRRLSVYSSALDFLGKRIALTPGERASLAASYGPAAAGIVSSTTSTIGTTLDTAVRDVVAAGGSVGDGMKALFDAFNRAGVAPAASYRLEAMFRTQSQLAYNAGRWDALQTPEIQEVLWGFEYNTVGDDRVRPAHAAMDGRRYPKDDPIWKTWWPPCGYNCRCSTLEIFRHETARQTPSSPPPPDVVPDRGFAYNPGEVLARIRGGPDAPPAPSTPSPAPASPPAPSGTIPVTGGGPASPTPVPAASPAPFAAPARPVAGLPPLAPPSGPSGSAPPALRPVVTPAPGRGLEPRGRRPSLPKLPRPPKPSGAALPKLPRRPKASPVSLPKLPTAAPPGLPPLAPAPGPAPAAPILPTPPPPAPIPAAPAAPAAPPAPSAALPVSLPPSSPAPAPPAKPAIPTFGPREPAPPTPKFPTKPQVVASTNPYRPFAPISPVVPVVPQTAINERSGGVAAAIDQARPGEDPRAVIDQMSEKLIEFAKQTETRIQIDTIALKKTLRDGRFKTQHETGSSGGMLDPKFRKQVENRVFGFPEDAPPESRPIYGYRADVSSQTHENTRAYGSHTVRLKASTGERTTITIDDSLSYSREVLGMPLHAPDARGATQSQFTVNAILDEPVKQLGQNGSSIAFIEAQIWGGVPISDIEEVVISSDPALSPEIIAEWCQAAGIKHRIGW